MTIPENISDVVSSTGSRESAIASNEELIAIPYQDIKTLMTLSVTANTVFVVMVSITAAVHFGLLHMAVGFGILHILGLVVLLSVICGIASWFLFKRCLEMRAIRTLYKDNIDPKAVTTVLQGSN